MKSTSLKAYFHYTRSQRSGLVALFSIILLLQSAFYFIDFAPAPDNPGKKAWLALQPKIDSLKKLQAIPVRKIYPFNPNFITDYKGYMLGMSVQEIDRLLAFRADNKFVNSAEEFQAVTKVNDSLLSEISPYFKFPDWVNDRNKKYVRPTYVQPKLPMIDINQATREDLISVYGIGAALSDRILKQRELLGGFVNMGQMEDIWGLSPEVIENLEKRFRVSDVPPLKKLKINSASLKELAAFPYFRYSLAKRIVTYRSMHGAIKNEEDLGKIPDFPLEKVSTIAVYLEF